MQLQTTASAISFSCCIFFGSVWKIRKAEFNCFLSNLHRSPKVGEKKKEKNNNINNNKNNFKAIDCQTQQLRVPRTHCTLLHAQNFFLKILKIILQLKKIVGSTTDQDESSQS
jgi:hypothetical protein